MYNKHNRETLSPVISKSVSWAQVCRELGIKPMTGSQTHVKKVAVNLGIDFSHFTGQAWSRGRKDLKKVKLSHYLKKDGPFITSHKLKLRLWRDGLKKQKCEDCGEFEWMGNELPLELDHVNNDHFDNRIKNLKILCPNCHSIKTRKERSKSKKHQDD